MNANNKLAVTSGMIKRAQLEEQRASDLAFKKSIDSLKKILEKTYDIITNSFKGVCQSCVSNVMLNNYDIYIDLNSIQESLSFYLLTDKNNYISPVCKIDANKIKFTNEYADILFLTFNQNAVDLFIPTNLFMNDDLYKQGLVKSAEYIKNLELDGIFISTNPDKKFGKFNKILKTGIFTTLLKSIELSQQLILKTWGSTKGRLLVDNMFKNKIK